MKILITSNGHSSYDKTGEVVNASKDQGNLVYTVILDSSAQSVDVRDQEFKILEEF